MLRAALPRADMWNTWYLDFGNHPAGLVPLNEIVDEACRDVGRDPAEIERTVAIYVQLEGGTGRRAGSEKKQSGKPIAGTREGIAEEIAGFAGARVGHIQVVLDPIDAKSVEELAEIVRLIR
jgi:hypothetical protein